MVLALLAGLALTVGTGLQLYAVEKHAGPLATLAAPVPVGSAAAEEEATGDGPGEGREAGGESVWGGLHELLADLVLALVVLHVGRRGARQRRPPREPRPRHGHRPQARRVGRRAARSRMLARN